jgi:ribosomal RNA-processing protein 17
MQMRKQRKEDLERHVSEVNRLVRQANGEISGDEDTSGVEDAEKEDSNGIVAPPELLPIDQEDEYIDEDKYTTVTIESVGISKRGFEKSGGGNSGEEDDGEGGEKKKKVWTKEKPKSAKPKKKKIKFRYETKAERKAERVKQGVKKKKMRESRAPKE